MTIFRAEVELPVGPAEALAWHARPGALERLVPPWQRVRIDSRGEGIATGSVARFRLNGFRWVARHEAIADGFADTMERGPFRSWRHEHRFLARPGGRSMLVDEVRYQTAAPVGRALARAFAWRHRRVAADLAAHATFAGRPRVRVGITGASGLLGADLTQFLTTGGHDAVALPRAPAATALEGLDVIVHLAGEPISARWTAERKRRILASREDGTRALAETISRMRAPPRALVCASAVGFYGDRGDEELDESSAPGGDFLADVCARWEAACEPARAAGLRVANLRTGIVLSRKGGALEQLLLPFRLGAGGPIGSGRQWMSWIAQDDWVYAAYRAIMDERASGPLNLVAPRPARNRELVKTLGHVLRRPAIMPLPALAVKALLGEMGEALLLESQRVAPRALERLGHSFAYPTLEAALRHELGR